MKYLVTGISGFLAEEIVKRLLANGDEVVGISRNETKLKEFNDKYPHVKTYVGDISDEWSVYRAMKDVHVVIHCAAFKHVGYAETNVFECINSNLVGSLNVLMASLEFKPKLVIGISTDKAAQPTGVYGKTKQLMERLFEEANFLNPYTKYRIVRYGNVLWSNGSILPRWKSLIEKGKEITVTDPEATRFFFTVKEAVDLIFECIEKATDSTPYIPKMKAMSVGDLLEAVMQKYGRVPVKYVGLQPGENKNETMDGIVFSDQVERFTIEEIKNKI